MRQNVLNPILFSTMVDRDSPMVVNSLHFESALGKMVHRRCPATAAMPCARIFEDLNWEAAGKQPRSIGVQSQAPSEVAVKGCSTTGERRAAGSAATAWRHCVPRPLCPCGRHSDDEEKKVAFQLQKMRPQQA